MRKVKWFLILLVGLISFFAVKADIFYADEISKPIILRRSSHVADTHLVWQRSAVTWQKMVEKESNGKLIVKHFTSGSLHGAKDGFKACVNDITDITHGYPVWQPASFNLFHGLDLPFAFPNGHVAALVCEELYPKYLKKEYEKMGVHLAFLGTTSACNLISKKPIRKLEDLKGMKIMTGGGIFAEIVKKLGAVPVMVTTADAYSAFQGGIVDAALLYDAGFTSFRLHEVGKYRTVLELSLSSNPYCLNRKTFDAMPPDMKKLLYRLERIAPQLAAQAYEDGDEQARDIMKKAGVQTIILPPEELARWKAAVEPLWEEFIAKNEAKGLPAKAMIKELRELSAKYSTWTPEQIMKHVKDKPIHGIIDGM